MIQHLQTASNRRNIFALALMALLVWSQVANANHLADHARANSGDQELCHALHTPAATLSISVEISFPALEPASAIGDYREPLLASLLSGAAGIRAPPQSTAF